VATHVLPSGCAVFMMGQSDKRRVSRHPCHQDGLVQFAGRDVSAVMLPALTDGASLSWVCCLPVVQLSLMPGSGP